MKRGRSLNRGCVSTVLNVVLSVGFCMPPVVTGTSTIISTKNNAEVPKRRSAKPTWAKLLHIFLGWIFRKVMKESKWDFWVAGVCPVCQALQAEATSVFVYLMVWRPLKRNLSSCFFSPSVVFL